MGLGEFLDAVEAPQRSLIVVNRSVPRPVQTVLENTFVGQQVQVDERDLPAADTDRVLLVDESGGRTEVIASSPLEALTDTILLVNSDLYKTGAVDLGEFELPDVLASKKSRSAYGATRSQTRRSYC